MLAFFSRLGPKLILTTLAFLLLLEIATSFLVTRGFRATQSDATQRSADGLEAQGQESLLALSRSEAQISTAEFQKVETAARQAVGYMVSMLAAGGTVPGFSPEKLTRNSNGVLFDPNPQRRTDVWVPSFVTNVEEPLARGLRDSAALDTLFPAILAEHPEFTAIYYIDAQGTMRYAPVRGVQDLLPPDLNFREQETFTLTGPTGNPDHKPYWMTPYPDDANQGLLVTVNVPVYQGDEFRGIISIDVSLTRLIEHLNSIKPTPGGYAFLVDRDKKLVAAPPNAIHDIAGTNQISTVSLTSTLGLDLAKTDNKVFINALDDMQAGKSDVKRVDLGGRSVFLSYAPLPNVGWSLALVAPVSEVTAQSATVSAAISQGTDDTVRSTLLTMSLFFLLALISMVVLSRRLTRPIEALVAGTRAIGSGDLNVTIPVTSRDELGILAHSFNQMTSELAVARGRLETWNQTLERTVEQRTAELAAATAEAQEARAASEQANQLKSQFLANMSHELRTPLNSIINFTRILSSGMRGPVNEGQIDYLNRVRQSGQHLLGLINDILDLSKIEAGRMELYKETLQINELVQSVMATAIGLTKDKPIELCQEIAPSLPPVEADHTRIRQVLLNLLSNAAKFTDEGTITVRVVQQGEELIISVADTGIGIAPEHIASIFEEFRQIEGSSSRRYEGTGLGLAICRRFIEMHGGKIWADSVVGAGSTFSFSLPIVPAALPPEPVAVFTPADHEGTAILVIDNDPATIEIVGSYLGHDHYTVYGTTDSRRALDEARRIKPSAIILDVLMPYKDGWEILSELKSDPELRLIPVVLYTIIEEQKLGFYLGASAYLTKPIDEEQLRTTVARLVTADSRILVIDDDPNAIEIVTRQLGHAGAYNVVSANSGRAGLDHIASERPDLIILDLMMPEIDGFAVLEQLDREPATSTIPVIVLTAKDLTRSEHDFLNQRVNGLLSKELTPPEHLLGKVADLLGAVVERRVPTEAEK